MDAHGRVIWSELNTRDPETAKTFYAKALGWRVEDMPMEGGYTYGIIMNGGERVGGMFSLNAPQFEGVPDHWLTYIGVDDVDHRMTLAVESGGTIVRAPWTITGVGRIGLLRAPGGAFMAWMTPMPPAPSP
ncbi:VOC family protein [Lichenifustis flavocetrariae]|uniref:VOC family protein n=1 Tax=Lichenifustis flavocetrariae TaxID=2949735 RepID=A0AA41YZV1_9HYPH|nr:VOC family protein [Lichenifustis flavocetrariae]MCW6507943.1 VOC family protein [Lichenifustis flavocetrariae]